MTGRMLPIGWPIPEDQWLRLLLAFWRLRKCKLRYRQANEEADEEVSLTREKRDVIARH